MRLSSILAILLLTATSSGFAQKVTTDPNAAGRTASAKPSAAVARYDPARDPDKRMARRMSYEALHVRLSAVLADLTKASGVTIICGSSTRDWQVRDVPVSVYAKDTALGVLLRAVARATHNVVTCGKVGDNYVYRVHQDAKLKKQLAGYYTTRADFCEKIDSWNWDAACALKDVPDGEFKQSHINSNVNAERLKFVRSMSGLIAAMGPEYGQRVMDGERLSWELSSVSPELKARLKAVLVAADRVWLAYAKLNAEATPGIRLTPLAPDELEKGSIRVYAPSTQDADPWRPLYTETSCADVRWSQSMQPSEALKPEAVKKEFGAPPRFDAPIEDDPKWADDYPDSIEKADGLSVKLDLSDLSKTTELTIAEAYVAVARRAGYSIAIEDWGYLRGGSTVRNFEWGFIPAEPDWTTRFSMGNLKDLSAQKALRDWGYYKCKLDDRRDRVIIGIDPNWRSRHLGLIPAALFDRTAKRLNGDGMDIDDIAPLMALTDIQWRESVEMSKDLTEVARHAMRPGDPLWQFYSGLSDADTALAKSSEGLNLSQYDPATIANLVKATCKFSGTAMPGIPGPVALHLRPVSKTILSMISSYAGPLQDYSDLGRSLIGDRKVYKPAAGLTSYTTYQLSVTLADNPDVRILDCPWARCLPFYSSKRAAELAKQATEPPQAK